jgi:hypothetical protein
VNRAETCLDAIRYAKSRYFSVPAHAADTRPHAFDGQKLLFLSHNVCLNDVKDRAVSGITQRNTAIQRCVNRLMMDLWSRVRQHVPQLAHHLAVRSLDAANLIGRQLGPPRAALATPEEGGRSAGLFCKTLIALLTCEFDEVG